VFDVSHHWIRCYNVADWVLSGFEFSFLESLVDVLPDDQMRASNMPFNSNLGDAHIVGDFGVGVTGLVRKIDFSRSAAYGVQNGREMIQTLLAIEDLIRSRAWGDQRVLSIDVVDLHFPADY
jgi:hypothetical protein